MDGAHAFQVELSSEGANPCERQRRALYRGRRCFPTLNKLLQVHFSAQGIRKHSQVADRRAPKLEKLESAPGEG